MAYKDLDDREELREDWGNLGEEREYQFIVLTEVYKISYH